MTTRDERVRVLIVEPAGLLWGSERALLDFLAHVDGSRFDVTVVCPGESPLRPAIERLGISTVSAPLALLHRQGRLARVRAAFALSKVIGRIAPHIVHVNQAGVLRIAALACMPFGVPIVCHVRLLEDARRLRSRPPRWLRPRRYIAVSDCVREELRGSDGDSAVPVSRIHDPFDECVFAESGRVTASHVREEFAIPLDDRIVGIVGRVCADKKQDLLVEAAGILAAPDVSYLIVGGVPDSDAHASSFRDSLKERALSLGLQGKVHLSGSRADVAAMMRECDLLVLASEEEAFGRVLLEALSLGKPIVAPAGGGPAEIVGSDERGLAFKPGNALSLAECINATFAEPSQARERTARGGRWVHDTCSPERHAREIELLYDDLVAPSRRATNPPRR